VFLANAAVFAVAFMLLALAPIEIHASARLEELVLLVVGLVAMLVVDVLLLRWALDPLARLVKTMRAIELLHPGRRAVGFERSSSEVLELAEAFNDMLQRLEDERRESSRRVLAAQEDERLRIARELHDDVGQTLTAVALRAEHEAKRSGAQHPEFAELAQIVQSSLEDVRRISLELRPGALDELGLVNALISLCVRAGEESGLRVDRRLQSPLPELAADVELAVYRIAQEALTNAMRHAGASEVSVSLEVADDQVVLAVCDDGRGFEGPARYSGGLTGMRERAMLIDSELDISSTAGSGVSITLRVPLRQRDACRPR
jgi:two-component system sensor histidine kinase UhpB